MPLDFETLRDKMVDEQLTARDIQSEAVLNAMRTVKRHLFVPENRLSHAYHDSPLAIGLGQTISQPYIVAYMTEQLESAGVRKILEIGTGSGYQTAILAQLGYEVYSIELLEELATKARKTLADLGYTNVYIQQGNGFAGWPDAAPFDAIMVTAAPDTIPLQLLEQLKEGGKMIIPVGEAHEVQWLKLLTKKDGAIMENDLFQVRFVPMVNH